MSTSNHNNNSRAIFDELDESGRRLMVDLMKVYLDRAREEPAAAAKSQPDYERALRKATMRFERGAHCADIARLDVNVPGIVFNDVRYINIGKTPQEVLVSAGKIYPELSVYRARGGHGGETIVPTALSLGLIDGNVSLTAAEICQAFVAEAPPNAARQLLLQVGTMTPSKAWLGNITTTVSAAWEAHRRAFEERVRVLEVSSLPPRESVSTVVVSLDGAMVRDKDAPNTPGAKKDDARPKGHREAYCATICLNDADGERLHTIVMARMPESKKVSLKQQLIDEVRYIKACYPDARYQAVADAAKENWRIIKEVAEELNIEFKLTCDFFHVKEHLCDGLKAGGHDEPLREFWSDVLMYKPNGAEECLVELKRLSTEPYAKRSTKRQEEIAKQITYFSNNYHMMPYMTLLDEGYAIGSGVQEAACKTVINQRMKRSGMSWRNPGGQGVLTPRALQHSGRLGLAWDPLGTHFRQSFEIDTDTKRKAPPWSQRSKPAEPEQNLSN